MDRIQKLREETTAKLERLKEKHYQEWMGMIADEQKALKKAKTVKEIKEVRKENERKRDLLDKRQTEEYISLQREFVEKLQSR